VSSDNRATLLRLAVAAIDEGGEVAIRVNHLAAAAGVTPPIVYHYFGNREGLVIAAQVERYGRGVRSNFVRYVERLEECSTAGELQDLLVDFMRDTVASGRTSRWTRIDAMGSAYARAALEDAICDELDRLVGGWTLALEPFRQRGWLRPDIHLPTAIGWLHSLLLSRVFVERRPSAIDLDRWDQHPDRRVRRRVVRLTHHPDVPG
jgi:AcrR family transcriptional regulator